MAESLDKVKLIVGLGNIGKDYEKTRHNAGFILADIFKDRFLHNLNWKLDKDMKAEVIKTAGNELVLAKPTTMMNLSGEAVQAIAKYYGIEPAEILVAYDDMDIQLGEFKLQFNSGPKVHNGLTSIRERLGTNGFWHLRLGIENREVKGNKGIPGQTYALQRFKPQELETFLDTCNIALDNLLVS